MEIYIHIIQNDIVEFSFLDTFSRLYVYMLCDLCTSPNLKLSSDKTNNRCFLWVQNHSNQLHKKCII